MDERERSRLNAAGTLDTYDREGRPIGLGDWVALQEDHSYMVVKRTFIGSIRVSTVWLGIDYGFGRGRPVLFETMVFDDARGHRAWDEWSERHHTEEDALASHRLIVAAITVAATPHAPRRRHTHGRPRGR